jgi:type II secretory pathway component PulK
VLVCVLWLIAILTVITIGFGRRSMMDLRAARLTLDHAEAMMLARGAVERGIVELRNKASIDSYYEMEGYTGYDQVWAKKVDLFKDGKLYEKRDGEEYADDFCAFVIRDAESRINLNTSSDRVLENIKSIKKSAIKKILRRRAGQAEDEDNPALTFQSIEEIRFSQGVDDDDWFGKGDKPALRSILSCWGDGLININTAPDVVLRCVPDLGEDAIRAVNAYRTGSDGILATGDDKSFKSIDELAEKTGIGGDAMLALRTYCKTNSTYFTITGVATRRQGKIRAECSAVVQIDDTEARLIKWQEEPFGS